MNERLYAEALAPFLEEVRHLRPDGAEVIDAHTHLGLDEDGRSLTLEQLLSQLDKAQASRACVFPLHDPERIPSYRVPNDRVLEWTRVTGGWSPSPADPAEERASEGANAPGGEPGHQAAPRAPGLPC